ncbi:MAG: hypothetical protein MJZ38_07310, partial [archaeon]|nr:hypothetical protein [archaeon]
MSKHGVTSREYAMNSETRGILTGLLYALFGLVTAICGQGMLNIIVLILGVIAVAQGVITYLGTRSVEATIVTLIIGAILVILGFWGLAADIIRILLGLFIVIIGVLMILGNRLAIGSLSVSVNVNKNVSLVIGLVLIVLGVIAM